MKISECFENSVGAIEDFLLDCVCKKIEAVSELPKMVEKIGYLDDKDSILSRTDECEILDTDSYGMKSHTFGNGKINIKFEVSFILQTFIESEYIWRVQSTARLDIEIPDDSAYNWDDFNPNKINFQKYKDLVAIKNIEYFQTECDTLYN